jgi:hypothetical protein
MREAERHGIGIGVRFSQLARIGQHEHRAAALWSDELLDDFPPNGALRLSP